MTALVRHLALGLLVLLVSLPALSQEEETGTEVDAVEEAIDFSEESADDLELIDSLLEDDAEVLEGSFGYDDGGRRDPFRSLLQLQKLRDTSISPSCPEGVSGLLIDEITISGVWVTQDGPVAQVNSASEQISFLIRPGDQLCDGDVTMIEYSRETGAEVAFKQFIDDPTAPKPFRDVVRRLQP